MPSFSRRRFAVTAFNQVFERLPDTSQANDDVADPATATATEEYDSPAAGHGLVEDVDFDTAIAEVLLTLSADRTLLSDDRISDMPEAPAQLEMSAVHDDDAIADDADADDGEGVDPEAASASEAATFRLLGELDRLWHGAP